MTWKRGEKERREGKVSQASGFDEWLNGEMAAGSTWGSDDRTILSQKVMENLLE